MGDVRLRDPDGLDSLQRQRFASGGVSGAFPGTPAAGMETEIEESAESDGEQVGGDVFEGEEAAEDESTGEGKSEGVDGGLGHEAGEFDGKCACG